ncbi:MAG: DUF1289 domain-containing protein [Gammaproteobacteria bacterium]|nr:DUF1289 domain-containing protein [Gammaproteobacteria bacterium]
MVRRSRPRQFDTSIPSPCVSLCQFYADQPVCIGCGRHQDEIRDWPVMTAEQKLAVLEQVAQRKKNLPNE